jgi:hypothetical protein
VRDDATTRDESGRWTAQGERVESDEGATRCRWTATEVRGEEAAYCNSHNIANKSYFYFFSLRQSSFLSLSLFS